MKFHFCARISLALFSYSKPPLKATALRLKRGGKQMSTKYQLMRLRFGLLSHDLAEQFQISDGTISSIFTTWVSSFTKDFT